MAWVMIVLVIFAMILFMGMIADRDAENRKNFTYAFCIVVLAIAAIAVLKM